MLSSAAKVSGGSGGGGGTGAAGEKLISSALATLKQQLHYYLVYYPLHELYRRTYWRNADESDICASLSGTTAGAHFWDANREECTRLIGRHFDGWLAVVEVGVYYLTLYTGVRLAIRLVRWVGSRWCSAPPPPQ